MKQVLNSLLLAAAVASVSFTASAAGELDKLLDQVKKDRISEGNLNKKREREFLSAKADKQALLTKAKNEGFLEFEDSYIDSHLERVIIITKSMMNTY